MSVVRTLCAAALVLGLGGLLGAGGCEARSACWEVCECRGGCTGDEYNRCMTKALELKHLNREPGSLSTSSTACLAVTTALSCASSDACDTSGVDAHCFDGACDDDLTACNCHFANCGKLYSTLAEESSLEGLDCINDAHFDCVLQCSVRIGAFLFDPKGFKVCVAECAGIPLPDDGT